VAFSSITGVFDHPWRLLFSLLRFCNAGAEMTLTPMQDGGRAPSGDVRDRIPGDGRRPCQRLPVLHDGNVQLRPIHGDGHVERDQEGRNIPSIHPSLNSELLSSESLTLHAPCTFAATARLVRPRRRRQRAGGSVEARVVRRGGGGGVDGRAGGGGTGGVVLPGLGVPRCQVPRRNNVPQVSAPRLADPEVTSGLSVITDIAWCCG
jgi:hypothetical protein